MKLRKLSPPLIVFLALLLLQIPLSFGSTLSLLCTAAIHETAGYIVLLIFESCGLLLLFCALGASFGAVYEKRAGRGAGIILLSVLAHLLGTVLSLIWLALFFGQAITDETLALLLGSILDSALLPLLICFFLSYFIYLQKGADIPKSPRDTASVTLRAIILASSLLFAYRLLGQILYAIEFVNAQFGFSFLNPAEKLVLMLDFIPVFGVSLGGYYLMLWAYRLYLRILKARADA